MRAKNGTLAAAIGVFERAVREGDGDGAHDWAARVDPAAAALEEAIRRQQGEIDPAVQGVAGDLAFAPGIDRRLDKLHDGLTPRLEAACAARWEGKIPFMYGGQEVNKSSVSDNAWGFLLDMIHHRGQLTTYLRPMGSTVPQIYGPSADEP